MVHNRPADTRTTGALDDCLVRLRDAKLVHCNRDGRIEPRFSGSPILFVVLSGQGFLTLGRHRYRLRRDAVYLCPPGHTFGMEGEPAEGVEIALFRFDLLRETKNGQGIEAVSERSFLPDGEIGVATADQLPGLCDTLFRCWHSRDELERFRSQIVFQELLWHLLKNRPSVRDPSRTRLDQAKTYMERNFHENLTIEQLARIADVSPKYFVDLFKKTYGISAMDYLTELRMIRARELMVRSRARLRDIAHQVGYQDEFYFSRKFKKEIGMSPTVYMKSRRRKVAACEAAVTGHLLALNMIPFAAPLNPKWTPYYYDTYRNDISVHLSAYRKNVHRASNLEKLRQVRPDIVISTDGLEAGEKEKLEQIAPVFHVLDQRKDWREQLRLTAEILEQPGEAEHWLETYGRNVTFARQRLKNRVGEETFLIVRLLKQNLYAYCNRSMAEVFYGDLQLTPACSFGSPIYNRRITLQELAATEADRLLLLICQETETLESWERLQSSLEWQELKAVRTNRVYSILSDPWCEYSANAHNRIVRETLRLLSGDCPE